MKLTDQWLTKLTFCINLPTYGIRQDVLVRRQQRDLSVFELSCHLPICPPHSVENSHFPFYCWTSSRKPVNANFYSLWFCLSGNRTRTYRFNSRRSIHSTIDRLKLGQSKVRVIVLDWKGVDWIILDPPIPEIFYSSNHVGTSVIMLIIGNPDVDNYAIAILISQRDAAQNQFYWINENYLRQ